MKEAFCKTIFSMLEHLNIHLICFKTSRLLLVLKILNAIFTKVVIMVNGQTIPCRSYTDGLKTSFKIFKAKLICKVFNTID